MWTFKFLHDTEVDGLGTGSAINEGFTYSRRLESTNMEDVSKFIDEAKEKFAAQSEVTNEISQIESLVTEKLNA